MKPKIRNSEVAASDIIRKKECEYQDEKTPEIPAMM